MSNRRAQQRRARTRFAAVRIGARVTQGQLANVTGLSISTIRRLDRGELEDPPVTYLINCAKALEVELEELLEPEWRWSVYSVEASEPPTPGWHRELTRKKPAPPL